MNRTTKETQAQYVALPISINVERESKVAEHLKKTNTRKEKNQGEQKKY